MAVFSDFFQHAAFDAVFDCDWPADGERQSGYIWQRAEVAPAAGREVWVKIGTGIEPPSVQWLTYIPALGALNGWDGYPETIPGSTFLNCRVAEHGEHGWRKVAVTEALPFPMLEDRIAPRVLPALSVSPPYRGSIYRFDNWELLWAPQDDAGYWLLARLRPDGAHVVAAGEWLWAGGRDEDRAWAGHVVIPTAVWRSYSP